VYHYTSEEAYNQIMRTKEFIPSFFSRALDAVYGEGWYFTDLPPFSSDEELYQLWGQPVPERTKRYLVFDIDRSLLQNTRDHVYRLPLERIEGGILRINLRYTLQGRTVIRFIRGGRR